MRGRCGRGGAFALVMAVCVLTGALSARASGQADRLDTLTRAFAAFDARDMTGRRWTAADLRGRVVVVDVWATWCPPCWREIPWLRRIHERFDPARVQVIGISLDVTDRRQLVSWLNRHRVAWPQIRAPGGYDGPMAEQFGVGALPMSLLIDPDGRVVAIDLRGARLVTAVEALLAQDQSGLAHASTDDE